jgi:ribosomal protein S18 acetylase RimI-like enzyme
MALFNYIAPDLAALEVMRIYQKLSPSDKKMYGYPPPWAKAITPLLSNFQRTEKKIRSRRAEAFVHQKREYLLDPGPGVVVGFLAFTRYFNAKPNKYERKYLGENAPMNYLHIKKIMVDPDWQGKGVGASMIFRALNIAKESCRKTVFMDVTADNRKCLSFLRRLGAKKFKTWQTPKHTKMLRFIL